MKEQVRGKACPLPIQYDPEKPMQVGGQAVMEGVMMRAPGAVATAVRKPNGDIVVKREVFRSWLETRPWLATPVLRGAVGLIEMMILGIRTLNWSAEIAVEEEEKAKAEKEGKEVKKASNWELVLTLVISLILGVAVFFAVPLILTTWLFDVENSAVSFNLLSGGIRVTILLLYMWGISLLPDVFRLFQYHGAEHKSIFAFEEEQSVDLDRAKSYTTLHPRCGTSFLLIVMVTAIISFAFVDALIIQLLGYINLPIRILSHLPLIPLVGGLSYEIIKFSARHTETPWGRVLVAPGLWLQHITTKEPDDRQLEVALVSLKSALGLDPLTLLKDEETTYTRCYPSEAAN